MKFSTNQKLRGMLAFAIAGSLAVGASISLSSSARAEAEPSTKPTTAPSADAHKRIAHVVKPWSMIASLTDDQKDKIVAIHEAVNEKEKALEETEKTDILAVLTPEQKTELKAAEDKEKADKKKHAAELKDEAKKEKEPAAPAEKKG